MTDAAGAPGAPGILQPGENVAEGVYEVSAYLGGGNSGEVYRLQHPKHGQNRVFKLFIPYYELRQPQIGQQDRGILTNQIIENAKHQPYQQREYAFLSLLDHPFIVKVHDFGFQHLTHPQLSRLRAVTGEHFSGTAAQLPYIIAAYVDGEALNAAMRNLGRRKVVRVIRSLAEAIDYLHEAHELLHLDIKSANVRVRTDGYSTLLDFALSQDLSAPAVARNDSIVGGIDWDLTPFRRGTSGIAAFVELAQTKGVTREQFKEKFFPWIDLFQFGLLLRENQATISAHLTPAETAYFSLLVGRLCDWDTTLELSVGHLTSLVERIDATRFFLAIRPGSLSGGKELPLSNGRSVFVPPTMVPIVEHPEVTRLNRLNQLSLLPARFCGATHSRYEHVADVLRLAQSAARRLLDIPLCRSTLEESDIEALLVAAFLHDINHLPLTHLYQESGLAFLRNHDLFRLALENPHPTVNTLAQTVRDSGLIDDAERLYRLIEGRWEEQIGPREQADKIISSLTNSGVDLDKLSYLPLDSAHSGLGFAAGIDPAALLQHATVVNWQKMESDGTFVAEGPHLAFVESALPLVEAVTVARFRGFDELYWCDDNRAMMALFLSCIRAISLAAGGETALADLMLQARGDTDFDVLRRIDRLSGDLVGKSWRLAQLFDAIAGTRPFLIYVSRDKYERIWRLSTEDRTKFEDLLRSALSERLSALDEGVSELMVDVPDRPLNLGGAILIEQRDGRAVEAMTVSAVVRTQAERLHELATRVRIFVSQKVFAQWQAEVARGGRRDAEAWVGQAVEQSLGRSSFR